MMESGIALRYATALFDSALEHGIVDDVHEEMLGLGTIIEEHPAFFGLLLSPQIRTEDKHDIINATLEGKASDLFVRFLHLLIDKTRFPFIKEIADEYHKLYESYKGVLMVKVTTAIPLDKAMERKVIDKLHSETQKQIRVEAVTDPDIIGGMIIQMKDKIIDGSIRFQLEKLRRELDEIGV
jgi:F-type H+-transporting ATPase subunit delta